MAEANDKNNKVTLAVLATKLNAAHEDILEIKRRFNELRCVEMAEKVARIDERSKRNAGIYGGITAAIVSIIAWMLRKGIG